MAYRRARTPGRAGAFTSMAVMSREMLLSASNL